jgi:hypothetical protein
MARHSWPLRPLPDGRGEVWRWGLGSVAELPNARSGLRHCLDAVGMPGTTAGSPSDDTDSHESAAERLILAFDELASNALRHGECPVVATVIAGSGGWLLDVSDRAPQQLPKPAFDRDPAHGGLGLHLVARMAVAHGWYVDGGAKHVWACLPSARSDRSPAPVRHPDVDQGRTRERPPLP